MTTASEIKVLEALDAAPGKRLTGEECRRAAKLTHRGWRQVENRMVAKNLVGRVFERGSPVEITFGGLRALRKARDVPAIVAANLDGLVDRPKLFHSYDFIAYGSKLVAIHGPAEGGLTRVTLMDSNGLERETDLHPRTSFMAYDPGHFKVTEVA